MLETIREFAAERLAGAAEDGLLKRHAGYYAEPGGVPGAQAPQLRRRGGSLRR